MVNFGGRKKVKPVVLEAKVVEEPTLGNQMRDADGEPAPAGYMDFGALYVPAKPGMAIRGELAADKQSLRSVTLAAGVSTITISLVAAPRSENLWPELAKQIVQSIEQTGGTVQNVVGKYGQELHSKVVVSLPDGAKGTVPRRFVGVDGPRWMARIVIDGPAAVGDPEQLELCFEIIDQLIVHRGGEPRVRLEYLPLQMPKGAVQLDGNA